ncbi:MAG: DUF455 family protein [Alphaproteobacteria bacterium]|nr:DUF455 family protein [Alphaproteobacteria bacterium]
MSARRRSAFWSPAQAAASLVQLAYVERALAHILAGWAVKMPAFDAKLVFAAQMHRAMERASLLRSRVNGLCHATASEATVPAGWRTLLSQVDRAPAPSLLVAAVYRWLYPQLMALYEAHGRETDPDGDRPSVDLIRTFLPSLESERRQGLALSAKRGDRAWLHTIEELWNMRQSGDPLSLESALWGPLDRVPAATRPAGARFCPQGSLGLLPVDPVHDPRDVGMFLHKELDEEYTTLELMARNSYEHPDMAWAFHRDMARQACDEARHAVMITRLLAARGFRHGDFAFTTSSYDGLYAFEPCPPGSRRELLWRMLIRQTFMEGLAVDNLAYEIDHRRAVGQGDIAAVFDYILRDEVFHAQSGLRWSRELLACDPQSVLAEREQAIACFTARAEAARESYVMANLDEAMGELTAIQEGRERRGGKLPERPLNRTGRRQAGYTDGDILQVVTWGYARDDAGQPAGPSAPPG